MVYFSVVKETEMLPDRFAAAEGRGAPLAEGLGADYAITKTYEEDDAPPRKKIRCMI
jgi:hypothetical protein